ncbi:MAG: sigma-70 family RNA polymerase sigma factor [Pirellulales bacterium]|nr:sigma-70 family RNA polymerase sigma factor [Pirellulales bacterium]|tara:strand:- start:5719 stop:6282 length:564 start_codon:yes stop_codon:yes gene_type:complete
MTFTQLFRELENGNQHAANDLLEQYGDHIRRIARIRLNDSVLRRVEDTMDIYQSVMANFFMRAATGQFDLETPEQLLALISTMIRNRVIDKSRFYRSKRRDMRRNISIAETPTEDRNRETPSLMISREEVINQFYAKLSEEERWLLSERSNGSSWKELAEKLNATPDQLRKRLARVTQRIAAELQWE